MKSHDILKLLREKHAGDYFEGEIGCGARTADRGQGNGRLDAWAMKPSWANPMYSGYEIKVSRADFLQDEKWPQYLPVCTHFYFVTPRGLIDKTEIPEQAGLIETTIAGDKLRTIKKSPRSKVDYAQLFNLLKAILLRGIGRDNPDVALEKMEAGEWEKIRGQRIANHVKAERARLAMEEERLKRERDGLMPLQRLAHQLDISYGWKSPTTEEIEKKWLEKNGDVVPRSLIRTLDTAVRDLIHTQSLLGQFRDKVQKPDRSMLSGFKVTE